MSSNAMTVPRFDGQAACAEIGGDDWFPEPGDTEWHRAKRICAGCEIQAECLAWALVMHEPHGIWGGLTVNERKRVLGLAVSGWAA
jgi:WhiB family redox-sensing transcriptional regulator